MTYCTIVACLVIYVSSKPLEGKYKILFGCSVLPVPHTVHGTFIHSFSKYLLNTLYVRWHTIKWFKFLLMKWSEVKSLSCVRLFATPWTVAHQAPLSIEFSRQEYWSGLPFLPPGDIPYPGIEPGSPAVQSDTLPSEPPGKPDEMKACSNFQ